jgi:hypothetical protein
MLTILGFIPYVIVGILLSSMGYTFMNWQTYAVVGCMGISDLITFLKYSD